MIATLLKLCYTAAMDTQFWQAFERGKVDGRYFLQILLGNGAFGGVFLAQEMIGSQVIGTVAIKLILPLSADQAAQLGELVAMRNLNHPHVVRGLAAGECTLNNIKLLYLVMDVATGTLEQRLKASTIPAAEVKEIVRSIAEGLQFLHRRSMVHRDLKPGNILCIGGKWQLADFGLIRTFGADSAAYTQTVAGTPYFMPPESFNGEVSPAWDVWSLGVLIVVTFTHQYPFVGASHLEIANAILTQPPHIVSPLPAPFNAIVQGCLIKDRRARWTASQVLTSLSGTVVASVKGAPVPQPQAVRGQQTAQTVPQIASLAKASGSGTAKRWTMFAALIAVIAVVWHSLPSNNSSETVNQQSVVSAPKMRLKPTHMHTRLTHRVNTFAARRLHRPLISATPHRSHTTTNNAHLASETPKPHTIHHVIYKVTARPRPVRSSFGDIHANSSVGSSSNHSNSVASSSSNDISGGLH